MKKSDLKFGMTVECRDGWKGKVKVRDNGSIYFGNWGVPNDHIYGFSIEDDLTCIAEDNTIMKIYDENNKLIWERK